MVPFDTAIIRYHTVGDDRRENLAGHESHDDVIRDSATDTVHTVVQYFLNFDDSSP